MYIFYLVTMCLISYTLSAQSNTLIFDDQAQQGIYLIEFNISERESKAIQKDLDFDVEFKDPEILVDGINFQVKSISTRGKSSLRQRRKSYTVKLEDSAVIPFKSGKKTLRSFYLISMSMDRNYVHNRFAFDCLNALGIFPLAHRYIALRINGSDEGIYLLTERPFDYLLGEMGSPYALRRLRSGVIDKDRLADNINDSDLKMYRKLFKQIHKSAKDIKGSDFYNKLDAQLDLHGYMRWLAFNYIVRNGDYTDEVYYYITPDSEESKFSIMPWDFDDILARGPHEGKAAREDFYKDKLIFSTEDPLDRKIAGDSTLYALYLNEMHSVINVLTENELSDILTNIYADLQPYFLEPKIITTSQFDAFGATNDTQLREYLQKLYSYMLKREASIKD